MPRVKRGYAPASAPPKNILARTKGHEIEEPKNHHPRQGRRREGQLQRRHPRPPPEEARQPAPSSRSASTPRPAATTYNKTIAGLKARRSGSTAGPLGIAMRFPDIFAKVVQAWRNPEPNPDRHGRDFVPFDFLSYLGSVGRITA